MSNWRFDQGRTEYHSFNNIVALSKALVALTGVNPRTNPCPIRGYFNESNPIWQFPPNKPDYTAWRNYARTFALLLLVPNGREVGTIKPTMICKEIAKESKGVLPTFDDYLSILMKQWCYPHPAFDQYLPTEKRVFPIFAILKMLVALKKDDTIPFLSPEDIFELLIGNNVSGEETVMFFKSLKRKKVLFKSDEKRQVRELLKFISQGSIFTWSEGKIHLSIGENDAKKIINDTKIITGPLLTSREQQFQEITKLSSKPNLPISINMVPTVKDDEEFIEGKKVRSFHVRTERNPKLRSDFLKTLSKPYTCDFCEMSMDSVYPWSKDFIEVHHLLPLASALKIGKTSTLLSDLVPLCPNCHRAVHNAYSIFLKDNAQDDFKNADEARRCYDDAKKQYKKGF